jgi:hypothetical protein
MAKEKIQFRWQLVNAVLESLIVSVNLLELELLDTTANLVAGGS